MKEHLLHLFRYNDWANTTLLTTVLQLPEKKEAVPMFSHMIYAQDRWYNRVTNNLQEEKFNWAGEPVAEDELEHEWKRSVGRWIGFLEQAAEEELEKDINFVRQADGQKMLVKLKDVALQLNLHAVHHRAQINKMISAQGISVPLTDYIYTALREQE